MQYNYTLVKNHSAAPQSMAGGGEGQLLYTMRRQLQLEATVYSGAENLPSLYCMDTNMQVLYTLYGKNLSSNRGSKGLQHEPALENPDPKLTKTKGQFDGAYNASMVGLH